MWDQYPYLGSDPLPSLLATMPGMSSPAHCAFHEDKDRCLSTLYSQSLAQGGPVLMS